MRVAALIKRIFIEMLRDKRTLALLLIAPLLILSLMYILFSPKTIEQRLGIVNEDDRIIAALEKADMEIVQYKEISNPKEIIMEDDLDGFLQNDNMNWILTLQNDDPSKAKPLQMKISQIITGLQSEAQQSVAIPKVKLDTTYVYGNSDTEFFDVLSPILIGFFVFFFVFLISGIGLLKERTSGTLERLLSTPIHRWEIVAAYLIGFGVFAIIQTVIVVTYAVTVLDITVAGSIWNVMLVNLLLALVALSLGILLSSFASSEFQMVQFIPIVVIPQIFFSGILPLEGMANWLQGIAKVMPLYYAGDALKSIIYKGMGLQDIRVDIVALIIFATVFTLLNIIALKKYRTL